ncbi:MULTISPECIES: hypothetical protein [Bacillus]|uniref:hypothetical protein n=1 Tax=Bacillus TaxID=1386 RepID=UPI000405B336|nr:MULTISPECIES: hypothetical protein [Bacillus]QHZ47895.1 hypothetical protein M654_017180 [Bacillus sp. NSP9.1]WFA03976.1 hypothetical protein P3X63_15205 [Bacillus sp. HSf4]
MSEQQQNQQPFSALNTNQQDQEVAQVIEKINSLVSGFGQSVNELVQKNSGIDVTNFSSNENTEFNQAMQNIINEYIQNVNSLNAEISEKIGNSVNGIITSQNKDA